MKKILSEIQGGTFARNWIRENETGRPAFNRMRREEADLLIERVGGNLRAAMPFLDPVSVTADGPDGVPRLVEAGAK